MSWRELHHTLAELVEAVQPDEGSGLLVDSADLDVPLEITTVATGQGIGVLGRVPHSRWKAGFLPAISMGHLSVELTATEDAARAALPERGGGAT